MPEMGFGDSVQGYQACQGQLTFNCACISVLSELIHLKTCTVDDLREFLTIAIARNSH